jgi:hypothetical protein
MIAHLVPSTSQVTIADLTSRWVGRSIAGDQSSDLLVLDEHRWTCNLKACPIQSGLDIHPYYKDKID